MMKRMIQTALLLSASMLLFACGGEKFELKVKANMNGQPAALAKVSVDGQELGLTDNNGDFSKNLERKAGTEVAITVAKEQPGHHTNPWKGSFVVKASRNAAEVYSFTADLSSAPFVTIKATSKNEPLSDAVVKVGGRKRAGPTRRANSFTNTKKHPPRALTSP